MKGASSDDHYLLQNSQKIPYKAKNQAREAQNMKLKITPLYCEGGITTDCFDVE
jgi:hypothetical protein